VKLGTENRKQVLMLAVLGVAALLLLAHTFWPSEPAATVSQAASAGPAKQNMRRTSSGRLVPVTEPRLDPTLDFDSLHRSEQIKYAGNGRNIFVAGSLPIEKPLKNGTDQPKNPIPVIAPPPAPPPPPPIALKFFGFANKPGEPKKVFLVHDDDVFIAGEGDIVDRRYRILHISTMPPSVDVEDVLNNNRQSLPLVQG
jgi:hypothetical protein